MSAYLITQVVAAEPERLRPYLHDVRALIERHGGELVDLVVATEVLEGDWPPGAFSAIARFPDERSLRAFWEDPDYEAPRRLRHEVASSAVVAAESILRRSR